MKCKILAMCTLLAGCGAPADRLTDEEAAAMQNADIETPQTIDVPPPISVAPPPAPSPSYKAVGTEPGWALTITPKTMSYEGDYGAVTVSEPTPPRFRPVAGRYVGTRLAVTITPGPCTDGMSDRTYRDTVTVVVEGKTVSGCGGGTIAGQKPELEPVNEPIVNTN